jgi:hypothetical protein
MKAKSKKKLIISILIIAVIIVLGIFIGRSIYRPVTLNNVKTVEVNYEYNGVSVHTQLDDEDAKRLTEICKGVAWNDTSFPSCGFFTVELVFNGNIGSTKLYPACDGCDTMCVGHNESLNYWIGENNRAELEKILAKYGVTFPCV